MRLLCLVLYSAVLVMMHVSSCRQCFSLADMGMRPPQMGFSPQRMGPPGMGAPPGMGGPPRMSGPPGMGAPPGMGGPPGQRYVMLAYICALFLYNAYPCICISSLDGLFRFRHRIQGSSQDGGTSGPAFWKSIAPFKKFGFLTWHTCHVTGPS